MTIRILIVDDHAILRAGLTALLCAEADLEVIGEACDEEEAVAVAMEKHPDVVLMDISMPNGSGIEATRRVKQLAPQTHILMLTMHEDKSLMQEAIRAGAMGYILKKAIRSELINAIHAVMREELYLHPAMTRLLFVENPPAPLEGAGQSLPEQLTSREVEVLRFIAHGYTNNQIAGILHISMRTVEYHRRNLTAKLNLHSRVDLMRFAEENNFV